MFVGAGREGDGRGELVSGYCVAYGDRRRRVEGGLGTGWWLWWTVVYVLLVFNIGGGISGGGSGIGGKG